MRVYRQKTSLKILFMYIGIFAIQLFVPNLGEMMTFGRIYSIFATNFYYLASTPIVELAGYCSSLILGVYIYLRLRRKRKSELKATILLSQASIFFIIFWAFHDFAYLTTAVPIILPTRGIFTIPPLFYLQKALGNINYSPPPSGTSGAVVISERKELSINRVQTIALPPWYTPLIDSTFIFLLLMFIPKLTVYVSDSGYSTPYQTPSHFDMLLPRFSGYWFLDQIFLSTYLLSIALLIGIWSTLEIRKDLCGQDKKLSLHTTKLIKRSAPIYLFWILHGLIVSPTPSCDSYYLICELSIPLPLVIALPFGVHLFWNAYRYPAFEPPRSNEIAMKLPSIDDESIQIMQLVGIRSLQDLAKEDPRELSKILELPQEKVKNWIQATNDAIPAPPMNFLPAIDNESIKIMQNVGIKSLHELAKENSGELCKILELPQEQVEKWIQAAREALSMFFKEEESE